MTLHQFRTHPVPVEGCFGCKVASVTFTGCFPTRSVGKGGSDATRQKKWDAELDAYRSAVKEGMEPDGTTKAPVEAAKSFSDAIGEAYGTPAYKQKVTEKVLERYI